MQAALQDKSGAPKQKQNSAKHSDSFLIPVHISNLLVQPVILFQYLIQFFVIFDKNRQIEQNRAPGSLKKPEK